MNENNYINLLENAEVIYLENDNYDERETYDYVINLDFVRKNQWKSLYVYWQDHINQRVIVATHKWKKRYNLPIDVFENENEVKVKKISKLFILKIVAILLIILGIFFILWSLNETTPEDKEFAKIKKKIENIIEDKKDILDKQAEVEIEYTRLRLKIKQKELLLDDLQKQFIEKQTNIFTWLTLENESSFIQDK